MKKVTSILGIAMILLGLVSFTPKKNAKADECQILVGLVYKSTKCKSGSVSNSFSEAAGYHYEIVGKNGYSAARDRITNKLINDYGVRRQDVLISSYSSPIVYIGSYKKDIRGWNCAVDQYAVGYGRNQEEAEQKAEQVKDSRNSLIGLKTINCN